MNNTNTTCKFCNDIVQIISDDITIANDSIALVTQIINATCVLLPLGTQKTECMFILSSISKIASWIAQGLLPTAICQKLGLC